MIISTPAAFSLTASSLGETQGLIHLYLLQTQSLLHLSLSKPDTLDDRQKDTALAWLGDGGGVLSHIPNYTHLGEQGQSALGE